MHRLDHHVPVEPDMLCAPIELVGGAVVSELSSADHWLEISGGSRDTGGAGSPIYLDELLDETHHHLYGRPWIAGRISFDFLVTQDLKPEHYVLDIGCGSGRLGSLLVRYLEANRYFGIDAHLRSLVAFSAYELRLHALEAKRPRLLLDSEFHFEHFGRRFDVALDLSVTRHLPAQQFRRVFVNLRSVLAPGGRVFVRALGWRSVRGARESVEERLRQFDALGYELASSVDVEWPFRSRDDRASRDQWYVFRLAETA